MPESPAAPRLTPQLAAAIQARKRRFSRLRRRIAIVGMAGRFPGGPNVEAFRDLLAAGGDAVTKGRPDDLDADAAAGEAAPWGGYLSALDRFDAEFFRIAPVEAELMDPQQRVLLETSWEALEDAGMDPGRLRGSRSAIYAGISNVDYRDRLVPDLERDPARSLYAATGTSLAASMGRVAFTLGFEGPAIATDTACSASLVAVHQAIVGLQRGEADLALAGGVNAILSDTVTRVSEKAGMLAPDGRCKTFDARADGYVRGEGCGLLVLKRLGDAERDGDRILGVLLGSAVNQDGASAGFTAPRGRSQERVIRDALARAEVEPSSVDYLEAHGTGTELGDPIEVRAAASVYGEGREAGRPLLLGSVKTNVGHLESAAGIAGVVKVLLALREGVIPPHLHFETPNPRIEWDSLPVRVTSEATPWPETPDRPARAAVSSFGFSGTNAHVILESYEQDRQPPDRHLPATAPGTATAGQSSGGGRHGPPVADETRYLPRTHRVLPLSAKTPGALSALAGRYRSWLTEGSPLADMAWTAGTGRSHFAYRAGLVFGDAETLREQLESLAQEPGEREASNPATPPKVAFLYTGQGSQWGGMGRDLYEREPPARAVFDRCEEVFRDERGKSLLPVMFGRDDAEGDLHRTGFTQPALFALAAALTELWRGVGVRPDAVLGHSVGEIAAAWASGAFDLEAGMRFAIRRGALMEGLPAGGAMAALFAPPGAVRNLLEEGNRAAEGVGLSLAAENGTHCVVSGPAPLLSALEDRCRENGLRTERLATSHAFHSALLDPVLRELESAAEDLGWRSPRAALVSNVTGRALESGKTLDGRARAPVRFAAGVGALAGLDARVLIEVGPRAVLGPLAALAWPAGEAGSGGPPGVPAVLASLGRRTGFAAAVARAYQAGVAVSFAGLFAGEERRRVSLPTYPFQRKRHWVPEPGGDRREGSRASAGTEPGARLPDLLYGVEWREVAGPGLAASDAAVAGGSWLLAGGGGGGGGAAGGRGGGRLREVRGWWRWVGSVGWRRRGRWGSGFGSEVRR